jgi:BASS family bile acid:Na+ symporter
MGHVLRVQEPCTTVKRTDKRINITVKSLEKKPSHGTGAAIRHENRIVRLLKDWTLPAAMSVGTAGYLFFANVPALDGVARKMGPVMDDMVPVVMFFILLVTFCKVDFNKMRITGWHLWVAAFQTILVGMMTLAILHYRLTGEPLILCEAVLTCIVAPCAAAAPVVTQKIGGDLEQMTTYTFLSNFITALLIPICFPLIEKGAHMTFLPAFLQILREVCIVLVLPMLLAYVIKHHMKRLHRRIIGVKDLSYYLWALSLVIVTGATVKNICNAQTSVAFLLTIAFSGMVLCIVQFAVGRYIGHFFGHTLEAGQGLGQKNTAFAIWITYTYLTPLSSVGPGCYILWQTIVNSTEIWQARRKKKGDG